jgi:nesprin-1
VNNYIHNFLKAFETECEAKLAKLQDTAAKSQEMTCQTNAHDEVDALHSRWNAVHDQALAWSNKLERLVATWGEFNQLEKQLVDWLQAKEDEVQTPINLNSPDVAKLESELMKLKVNFYKSLKSVQSLFEI